MFTSECRSFNAIIPITQSRATADNKITNPEFPIIELLKSASINTAGEFRIKIVKKSGNIVRIYQKCDISHPINANRVRDMVFDDLLPACRNANNHIH